MDPLIKKEEDGNDGDECSRNRSGEECDKAGVHAGAFVVFKSSESVYAYEDE